MRHFSNLLILLVFLSLQFACNDRDSAKGSKPNILFIIGDDIGYSDLGCYGSEIETPTLDRLAEEGARFRQFYNMAKCNPTRSSLHTGMFYGDDSSPSLGMTMRKAGYQTLFVGKEHFDAWVPRTCYADTAFDRSITFWAMNNYFLQPDGSYPNKYFVDGVEVRPEDIPSKDDPWFLSDVMTDHAIEYLEACNKDEPIFLYLSYLNAHYPLQAKPGDIQKYRGRYMEGWDSIREKRFDRQLELGLREAHWELSPPSSNINRFRGHPGGYEEIRSRIPLYEPWNGLSDSAKQALDLEMAVFAALVDNMDQNIKRVLDYLESMGELDNTIIMYMSDNGSCPYDSNRDFELPPGHPESFRTLNPKWANVGNTPFRYYKQYGFEGGANTHFIAWWPEKIGKGQIIGSTGHVVDILPTLAEIAGVEPDQLPPVDGKSLLELLEGGSREPHPYMVSGLDRHRMYREDNYKMVRVNGEAWQLYDLDNDPTEIYDLADSLPGRLREMEARYEKKFQK